MENFTFNGTEYRTHDLLTFGDYGGAGSIGLANIRTILGDHANAFTTSFSALSMLSSCSPEDYREGITTAYPIAVDHLADAIVNDPPEIIHARGGYSSETLYVRADVDDEEGYISCVSDYPLLDENKEGEILIEWEDEAWSGWVKHDLTREHETEYPDEVLWEAYRKAMEECNVYPVPEYSGVYIDVDHIQETFDRILAERANPS